MTLWVKCSVVVEPLGAATSSIVTGGCGVLEGGVFGLQRVDVPTAVPLDMVASVSRRQVYAGGCVSGMSLR